MFQTIHVIVVLHAALTSSTHGRHQGILINGRHGGTQLYSPSSTPIARGNLDLALPSGTYAFGGAGAINGELAYFASSNMGEVHCGLVDNIRNTEHCSVIPTFVEYNNAVTTNTARTRTLASMPQGRSHYGMTADVDTGSVLVCGGKSNGIRLATCIMYNDETQMWSPIATLTLQVAVSNFPMITLSGSAFVFGGALSDVVRENRVFMLTLFD
jgi:hypothetical protein